MSSNNNRRQRHVTDGAIKLKKYVKTSKGKGKEFGWVSITPARGPLFGPNVLPFSITIFLLQYKYCMLLVGNQVLWKLQCKSLHFKSTKADVHYASASFGTTSPSYITLPYLGFEPGTFGFQVSNATA
jgi:hypothetical protein